MTGARRACMQEKRELRLRVKGATGLKAPNHNAGPFDAFCVATLGHARFRTHTVKDTTEPKWEHEVVFGSDAVAQGGGVLTLEVWDDKVLADQLLGKAYIDLALYHDHEASCTNRESGGGEQGSNSVQQHCVALLPGSSKAPGSRRVQQRPPLTRSSHVSMQGEVLVEWWWADEPILLPSGKPPRVLSFAARPGGRKHLPSVSQTAGAVLYEVPCMAFVKLSVREVCLGAAAQGAPHQVLRSIRGLLLGGQRARDEMDTLASRSTAASRASSKAGSPKGASPAQGDWQQVTLSEGEGTDDSSDEESASSSSGQGSEAGQRAHRPLYVVCSATVGSQQLHRTKPVAMGADGVAPVQQPMTFTVLRPLVDQEVVFGVHLQRGRNSRPTLTLQCRYSLLDLLCKSPQQACNYEAWCKLRANQLPGVHVPMPGLPEAFLDLGAYLADADCRAGMYSVPAVAPDQAAVMDTAAEAAAAGHCTAHSSGDDDSSQASTSSKREPGVFAGIRRRLARHGAVSKSNMQQQGEELVHHGRPGVAGLGQELWQERVRPGLEAHMGDVAEATRSGVAKAVSMLPAPMAKHVKRGFIGKVLAPRAEVLSLGKVHVACAAPDADAAPTYSDGSNMPTEAGNPVHTSGPGFSSTYIGTLSAAQMATHPNLAVSGSPGVAPVALLRLTVRLVHMDRSCGAGVSLVMRCGPHWLHAQESAVPIAAGDGPPSTDMELQVVCPVYIASKVQFTLILQRRGAVLAMHGFQATGLLPLLLREHNKTVTMYSPGHKDNTPVARVALNLAATAMATSGMWSWGARLLLSYMLTSDTLALHTSTVAATMDRDAQADALAMCAGKWLHSVEPALPGAVVVKVLGVGQRKVSLSRMRTQLERIKACLGWLPRRLDPVALYHWHTPWHNLLLLWVLSQACFHPGKWLLTLALLAFIWMLRRFAIQLRTGIFGFELVAQPTEDEDESASVQGRDTTRSTSPTSSLKEAAEPHVPSQHVASAPHAERRRQRRQAKAEAAELKRAAAAAAVAAGKDCGLPGGRGLSLEAMDTLNLEQLASVRGLLRLARAHAGEVGEVALLLQECLETAARAAEKAHALISGQDIVASIIAYSCAVASATLAVRFGLGIVLYCWCLYLLRPPMLRGVPGVFGPLAFFSNLSSQGLQPG